MPYSVYGSVVYQCDVCKRKTKVDKNIYFLDVIQRCTITENCVGKLHPIKNIKEINETPRLTPVVNGLNDWFQRRILYTHYQTIESSIWLVEHNLGSRPTIQVLVKRQTAEQSLTDDNGCALTTASELLSDVELPPDSYQVEIIDENSFRVIFDRAESGLVQCIATSSRNEVNPRTTTTTSTSDLLLTNNGELTIATTSSATIISLVIEYRTSVDNVSIPYAAIGLIPSLQSPWVGAEEVFVEGKKYYTRSFNIRTEPPAPGYFQQGLIIDGSPVVFSSFPSIPAQNIILLGRSPFAVVDRVADRIVDIGLTSSISPEIYYNEGNLYVRQNAVRSIYPPVIVVA